ETPGRCCGEDESGERGGVGQRRQEARVQVLGHRRRREPHGVVLGGEAQRQETREREGLAHPTERGEDVQPDRQLPTPLRPSSCHAHQPGRTTAYSPSGKARSSPPIVPDRSPTSSPSRPLLAWAGRQPTRASVIWKAVCAAMWGLTAA